MHLCTKSQSVPRFSFQHCSFSRLLILVTALIHICALFIYLSQYNTGEMPAASLFVIQIHNTITTPQSFKDKPEL